MNTDNQVEPQKNYFNIAQFRSDTWTILKNNASKLRRQIEQKEDLEGTKGSIENGFEKLKIIEHFFAFPGLDQLRILEDMYLNMEYGALANQLSDLTRTLVSESYRSSNHISENENRRKKKPKEDDEADRTRRNYFEMLFVDNLIEKDGVALKHKLKSLRAQSEQFLYDVVLVSSFQDALIALLFNPNIQSCVIRYGIPYNSKHDLAMLKPFITGLEKINIPTDSDDLGQVLGMIIKRLRPELELYYVTDTAVSDIQDSTLDSFNRIFYRKEDLQEIHLSVQRDIKQRFETPFFSALMEYSQKPTGVFHAMPISRGNSVFKSRWIKDFGDFYGRNLFLAETSATTGGLDSLLQPVGPLKRAQEMASKAYGSNYTFFVTNGTSTANKIVLQALVAPEDVVLIDRDCHKSHHYGLVLSGAYPVYLDSYPVPEYSMYGAVPLSHIIEKLKALKSAGRLNHVKMLLLTNCTFDGIVYNVEKVMEAVLAIKPDMVFLWDEAWFAFAGFTPTYKQRTAMYVAKKLSAKYQSESYRKNFEANSRSKNPEQMVDPDAVKVRVYSTQSTHKTLSSLRQGSMIHIFDEEFKRKTEDSFHEAYKTHTSTSPNYQILASLDVGRRQVQFEGYEMVEKSIEMAMVLRSKIAVHPKLTKYFDVLTVGNFIPEEHRQSGITEYFNPDTGWNRMEEAWMDDEFVLDPTKINLFIGRTGVDGDTFKNKYLMDQFGIQINKTSRNTVLFMTNIGTTRSSVAYLISVLLKISEQLDAKFRSLNEEEMQIAQDQIRSLTEDTPPLPDFSHFHSSFQAVPGVPGGNLRAAYFLSYDESKCEHIKLEDCAQAMKDGRDIVSASFVIPYPPGFPILVPGQVLSPEILEFFIKLDVKEIHGYRPEMGLRIFVESVLNRHKTATAMMGSSSFGQNGGSGQSKTAKSKQQKNTK